MRYKLAAIDLDGTLLDDEKRLSARSIDMLRCIAECGVALVISTGRPYNAAKWVLERAGVEGTIVSDGGASAYRFPSAELLFESVLPRDVFFDVLTFSNNIKSFMFCMKDRDFWYEQECKAEKRMERYFGISGIHTSFSKFKEPQFTKINLMLGQTDVRAEMERLADILGNRAVLSMSDTNFLDITATGVDKAATVLSVAKNLGISPSEIIAFGDASNDVTLLQSAGLGVCPSESSPEALAVADVIAPSNNADGVARAAEIYLFGD
ncbi:MAG: HAD family hydrolase [Oscillospiraceae bacterium]